MEGVLYCVPEKDIFEKLDKYEGFPRDYFRIRVLVILDNGKEVKALTYIANPDKVREGLKPSQEYLNHLLKACKFLSKEYYNWLKNIKTLD
ncbi:MAG: gamma-glutamylcyclotransferase [Thermodesulfobacteriaceae bacterium]|nr:gamma-glutamylcyclotransferase [Thermodesulfobacteriaceae bacterium]MDW8136134.1 gamma-glutamylcyclotransferase [Thermodesulfobacterium sp.]